MKKAILFITAFCWLAGVSGLLAYEGAPYIIMTTRDNQQVKLEYDTQVLPFVALEVKDELDCTPTPFNLEDVAEVTIVNLGWNTCEQREEWIFEVSFQDAATRPLMGFIEIQETKVRGRLFIEPDIDRKGRLTGRTARLANPQRAYDFTQVRKLTFHRGEN
jgi:hypothetical protein